MICALTLLLPLVLPSEDPPAAVDLRVYVEEHERTRVDVTRKFTGSLRRLPASGEPTDIPIDRAEDLRVVDEYQKVVAGQTEMTRRVVRWQVTDQGRVQDPELAGLEVHYQQSGGQYHLTTGNGRRALKPTVDRLLNQAESVGAFLKLPQQARPGESFQIDCRGLLPLLLDADRPARVAFAEVAVDQLEGPLALLKGTMRAELVETSGEVTLESVHTGDCRIAIDVQRHRLQSIDWQGDVTLVGADPAAELEGTARFEVHLETAAGPAADNAWDAQPLYRDVERHLAALGVVITLPSHWYLLPAADDEWLLQTTALAGGAEINLELKAFASTDQRLDLQATEESIVAEMADAKGKPCSSGLGEGRSLAFDNQGLQFVIDLFPLGTDRILRVRLYGEAAGMEEGRIAYTKARRSLAQRPAEQ